jgi:hypothetical protein
LPPEVAEQVEAMAMTALQRLHCSNLEG